MKLKIFHWENFIAGAWIIAIVNIVFTIKTKNIFNLDILAILLFLTVGFILRPDKTQPQKESKR